MDLAKFGDQPDLARGFADAQAELNRLITTGDVYAGFAWQIWTVHIGINADFLLDDLSLGLKFGKFQFDENDLSVDMLNVGVAAQYLPSSLIRRR